MRRERKLKVYKNKQQHGVQNFIMFNDELAIDFCESTLTAATVLLHLHRRLQ